MAWQEKSEDGRRVAEEQSESGGGDIAGTDIADPTASREIENEDIVAIRRDDEGDATAKTPIRISAAKVEERRAVPSSPFRQNKSNSPSSTTKAKKEIVVEIGHEQAGGHDASSENNPSAGRALHTTPVVAPSLARLRPSSLSGAPAKTASAQQNTTLSFPRVLSRKSVVSSPVPVPVPLLHSRHTYAHLAVQQVRQIEKQRRAGHGMTPNPKPEPKTAEQFYQWLTSTAASASSATESNQRRRRKEGETEYRLGLGSSGHERGAQTRSSTEHRHSREITLVPAGKDDDEDSFVPNDNESSVAASAKEAMGVTSDEDDSDDEDTAVAVATMMIVGPTAATTSMNSDGAQSRQKVAPAATPAVGDPREEKGSAPEAAAAWREASRIVAECHDRMVSVQENAKLKQQQLRLRNEHLQFLLEASKLTIEQLQMRLIFSKSSPSVSSSMEKQQATSLPLRQVGTDSSIGNGDDPYINNNNNNNNNNNKSRPSLSDVRDHVESVLAHQHVLLEENAALKQALLQCGCDRCLEKYRVHERSSSHATMRHDAPLGLQSTHTTDSNESHPGTAKTATNSPVSDEIPIPSVVPTEDSNSSSASSNCRQLSPIHHVPAELSSEVVDAISVVRADVIGDSELKGPIAVPLETIDPLDTGVALDNVATTEVGDDEANNGENEASDHGNDGNNAIVGSVPGHAEDRLVESVEDLVERAKVMPRKPSKRRTKSGASGPSLGEYLTTQQDDMNTSGSLAEHEYDRRYSRSFAESISLLSSMSRITFKTIDEDITVDCSMVDDEARQKNDASTGLAMTMNDASTGLSMTPNESGECGEEDSFRTFAESNGSTPPNRYSLVGSASSITTSLSNNDHADSFRVSTHSGEATVRNANRGGDPGRSILAAAGELRSSGPRRGRKSALAPALYNQDVLDVSLDQVYLSSDPSKFISPSAIAPFAKSQVKVTLESPSIQMANRSVEVPSNTEPTGTEVWQHKYVNSDDLYSSAVMSAMEKRKKGSSIPRHGRDSNPERFVAELSKCLQGGSTHSSVVTSESFVPPDQQLAYKAIAVPSAMRSPQHPLSYDDALVAAMSKESAHIATSGSDTGGVPSSASHRKGQWKAPTVFKSWK